MRKIIETDRLLLREFADVDARDLYALNSDPTVIRYTGVEPFADYHAALAFLQSYDHYGRHGFGRWAVLLRHTGQFAGFCGLHKDPRHGRVDLGFRFHRRFWAQGIATEAARAALTVGFTRFQLPIIFGRVMRENLASVSVLQKIGMSFREVAEGDDSVWLIYAIRANEFVPPAPPAPPAPAPEEVTDTAAGHGIADHEDGPAGDPADARDEDNDTPDAQNDDGATGV